MSMSDSYTAYLSPGLSLYDGDVGGAEGSNVLPRRFFDTIRHPCLTFLTQRLEMDDTETRSVEPMLIGAAANNERSLIILKVVGEVQVQTAGKDSDDTTPLTGYQQCYGTSYMPGIYVLTGYNIDSITLEAEDDDTVVNVLTAILAISTDSRI